MDLVGVDIFRAIENNKNVVKLTEGIFSGRLGQILSGLTTTRAAI